MNRAPARRHALPIDADRRLLRLALSVLLFAAAFFLASQARAQQNYTGIYARGLASGGAAGPVDRAEASRYLTAKIKALRESGAEPAEVALKVSQYEFYLAALEAVGREELIKSAIQRQGERAQGQLVQVGNDTRRMSTALEKAVSK